MYIRKVEIKNIRSISEFEMEFPFGEESGWHVLIGDNGAGKSSIVQAIAMGLIGGDEVLRLDPIWESWVKKGQKSASINLYIGLDINPKLPIELQSEIDEIHILNILKENDYSPFKPGQIKILHPCTTHDNKRFGCGFGPFRRFSSGEMTLESRDKITPITPFETLFRPEVILSSSLAWVKDLHLRKLEEDIASAQILDGLIELISLGDLLPNHMVINKITADGIFFKDVNGVILQINELSDGVKSILALTFELIRLILNKYSANEVFESFSNNKIISVPGVVLIDEIDAHLHPTWQTRIGQWFTHYFPNLQFIVTTHSPLICRGCLNEAGELNGSVWRLAAPGSTEPSGILDDTSRDRLLYGNVLDAYGTGAFGSTTSRSEEGNLKMNRLAELNVKSMIGAISEKEETEMHELKTIFPTHA